MAVPVSVLRLARMDGNSMEESWGGKFNLRSAEKSIPGASVSLK